jgi:hypothetical protein
MHTLSHDCLLHILLLCAVPVWATIRQCGLGVSAACGLSVTALALVAAFIPPEGASWLYEVKMIGGCAAMVAAANRTVCRSNLRTSCVLLTVPLVPSTFGLICAINLV